MKFTCDKRRTHFKIFSVNNNEVISRPSGVRGSQVPDVKQLICMWEKGKNGAPIVGLTYAFQKILKFVM